ncbi:MAG: hypothetical protein EPO00_11930 [Chloroflexota bacterium]|nr:MAG: hypothetical protein EPO00_11930 [Chloroflexota bacterium]
MTDLAWIWLFTIVTILATSIIFVLLAIWSSGGAAPWSIVPGLIGSRPTESVAESPLPPLAMTQGSAVQGSGSMRATETRPDLAGADIEELGTRRF